MKLVQWGCGLIAATALVGGCATSSAAKGQKLSAAQYFCWSPGATFHYRSSMLGANGELEVTLTGRGADGSLEDSTGAKFLRDSRGVRDQKRYLLRDPVVLGTTWDAIVSVSSIERYKIVEVAPSCATAGGTWGPCVTVEGRNRVQEGKDLVNRMTLARGVGIVRLVTSIESPGQTIPQTSLELTQVKGCDSAAVTTAP